MKPRNMNHLEPIILETIPHKEQRYDTGGDYDEDDLGWWVNVSEMEKWQYEALCMIHELTEMFLTKHRKIDWDKITKFDTDHPELEDPGSDKRAPYHKEHMFSMKIEKMLCMEMGISWDVYDKSYSKLVWKSPKNKRKN